MTPNYKNLIVIGLVVIAAVFIFTTYNKSVTNSEPTTTSTTQQVDPKIGFEPATLKLAKGKQSSVNIALDLMGQPAVAVTISISYDPSKIKIVSLKNGALFTNVLSGSKIAGGKATLSIATPPDSKGVLNAGTVAMLQLESLSDSASTITFASDTMAVSLNQEGNILKNIGSLKIN